MSFILKKRSFLTHLILFFCTGGIWLFVYIISFIIYNSQLDNKKGKLQDEIIQRENIQKEIDQLELDIKKEKLKELKLKNKKLEKDN